MKRLLLSTKLSIPPAPPRLVRRPRLLDKIQDSLHHKLTLMSAPAGYGKTTLLTEWARQMPPGTRVAWLSLEAAESDPIRFWDYFIAAVGAIRPGAGEAVLPLLRSPQPPPLRPSSPS